MLDMTPTPCHVANVTDAFPAYDEGGAPSRRYPLGPKFYCVRTGYNAEIIADIELRLKGYEVLNPSIWKPETKPRRDANGVVRPGRPPRIEPLFKRYIFCRFDRDVDPWQEIRRLRGVDELFSSERQVPTPIPDAVIDRLRAMLSPNLCLYPPSHHAPCLAVGSKVKVMTGPLADHAGICQASDGRRVEILLEILHRSVTVKMDQSAVEPA